MMAKRFAKGQLVTFTPVAGALAGKEVNGTVVVPREVHGRAPYAVVAVQSGKISRQLLVPHRSLRATCSGCYRTQERRGNRLRAIVLDGTGECAACTQSRAEVAAQ